MAHRPAVARGDAPGGVASQDYLPEALRGSRYYQPTEFGFERTVTDRLTRIREMLGRDGS